MDQAGEEHKGVRPPFCREKTEEGIWESTLQTQPQMCRFKFPRSGLSRKPADGGVAGRSRALQSPRRARRLIPQMLIEQESHDTGKGSNGSWQSVVLPGKGCPVSASSGLVNLLRGKSRSGC